MNETNTQGAIKHTKRVLHSIIKQIRDIIRPDTYPSIADKMIDSVNQMREYSKNGAHDKEAALSILTTAIEIAEQVGDTELQITAKLAAIEVATLHCSTPHPTPQLYAV